MSNLTLRQGFAPQTMGEAIQFSEMLAKSQMVPKQYQGKPEDILVAVQWGYEIGLAPLQALQNISVINGKPSVYGDADRKSTRLNSSHSQQSRMPSSA